MYDKDFQYTLFIVFQIAAHGIWEMAKGKIDHGGGRRARTLYADSPPPPPLPCWVLARKCRTMGAKGALRNFGLT